MRSRSLEAETMCVVPTAPSVSGGITGASDSVPLKVLFGPGDGPVGEGVMALGAPTPEGVSGNKIGAPGCGGGSPFGASMARSSTGPTRLGTRLSCWANSLKLIGAKETIGDCLAV